MSKRTEVIGKQYVTVYARLTVADVEYLLKYIPDATPCRTKLEEAIEVDERFGHWPHELITAFVMEDAFNAYTSRYFGDDYIEPLPKDIGEKALSTIQRAMAEARWSDLADAVLDSDWFESMGQCMEYIYKRAECHHEWDEDGALAPCIKCGEAYGGE